MSDIIITGEPYFIKSGSLIVERGEVELYRSEPDADGLNPQQIKVQTSGDVWNRNDPIKLYIWTRDPPQAVGLSVYLRVELDPTAPTATIVPPNRTVLNQLISTEVETPNTALVWLKELQSMLNRLPPGQSRFARHNQFLTDLAKSGFGLHDRDTVRDGILAAAIEYETPPYPEPGIAAECKSLAANLMLLHETLPAPNDTTNALFPLKSYGGDEIHTRLVNMKGNARFLLTMDNRLRSVPAHVAGDADGATVSGRATVRMRDYAPVQVGWVPDVGAAVFELPDIPRDHRPNVSFAQPTVVYRYPQTPYGFGRRTGNADPRFPDQPRYDWYLVQLAAEVGYHAWAQDTPDANDAGRVALTPNPNFAHVFGGVTKKRYVRMSLDVRTMVTVRDGPRNRSAREIGGAYGGVRPANPAGASFHTDNFVPFDLTFDVAVTDNAARGARARIKYQIRDALGNWTDLTNDFPADYDARKLWTGAEGAYVLPSGADIMRAHLRFVRAGPTEAQYLDRPLLYEGQATEGADFNASMTLLP